MISDIKGHCNYLININYLHISKSDLIRINIILIFINYKLAMCNKLYLDKQKKNIEIHSFLLISPKIFLEFSNCHDILPDVLVSPLESFTKHFAVIICTSVNVKG